MKAQVATLYTTWFNVIKKCLRSERRIYLQVLYRSQNYFPTQHQLIGPVHVSAFICICLFDYFGRYGSPVGQGIIIHEVSRSHTTTRHSRYDSSGRMISSSQRPLSDNTQQSQQTDIHAAGGIRTHNLSRRAAADLRLRPRCHRSFVSGQYKMQKYY